MTSQATESSDAAGETHARKSSLRGWIKNQGGAVYVEFLIAFMPTFFLYFGVCEIALMYTAKLQVTRATTTAVRAAVVVLPDHPKYYNDVAVNKYEGRRKELIEAAAHIPLFSTQKPWRTSVELTTEDGGEIGMNSKLKVTVRYFHRCLMPIIRHIACRRPSGFAAEVFDEYLLPAFGKFGDGYYAELTDSATMTNHGAAYDYVPLKKKAPASAPPKKKKKKKKWWK